MPEHKCHTLPQICKPSVSFLPLLNYEVLSVGLSHKTVIKPVKICGCTIAKCEQSCE